MRPRTGIHVHACGENGSDDEPRRSAFASVPGTYAVLQRACAPNQRPPADRVKGGEGDEQAYLEPLLIACAVGHPDHLTAAKSRQNTTLTDWNPMFSVWVPGQVRQLRGDFCQKSVSGCGNRLLDRVN